MNNKMKQLAGRLAEWIVDYASMSATLGDQVQEVENGLREAFPILDFLSPPDGDGLVLETTAGERREWRETAELLVAGGEDDRDWGADPLRLLRDLDKLIAALAAEKARARHWENQAFGYQEVAAREIERVTAEYNRAEAAEARYDTLAGALAEIFADMSKNCPNQRGLLQDDALVEAILPDAETDP